MQPKRNNMEVITINIFIGIGLVLLASIGFLTGFFVGISSVLNILDNDHELENIAHDKRHCFECEMETPVKLKNGGMYCSNCGLHH